MWTIEIGGKNYNHRVVQEMGQKYGLCLCTLHCAEFNLIFL